MFWRFGFHNASAIDSLLDKEDVSLEAILDEDDLLQECKAQNTRLIDYFSRVNVLQRLLGYVTGQIESEDKGSFKYPFVATEVLCSEIWSIVETCIGNQEQLLVPFWETVLDKSPEEMKSQVMMAAHFAKVNVAFLSKKPAEMLAFIQAQSDIVERILRHIESPPFADLLVRIIQLDEHPAGAGVLEWLSKENLMSRLIDLLSPAHSSDMHTVVAELIKGIISMAAPSPAAGISDGLTHPPASNVFARELAHRDSVTKLVSFILYDFGPGADDKGKAVDAPYTPESAASSVIQSICIIIELIRQNNSDYFEPYLFHTVRTRLIQVQQQMQMNQDGARESLEAAMKEMVNRMGVVHLGPVLDLMCDHLDQLQRYLKEPRSQDGPVLTSLGAIPPLTFERYRICELYAELLHCSNMSLLNRSQEYDRLYDAEGRLQGGLSSLEELAQVIAIGNGSGDNDGMDDDEDVETESVHEFPISHAPSSSLIDSDEDMSGDSSDEEAMEEIAMYDSHRDTSPGLRDSPMEQIASGRVGSPIRLSAPVPTASSSPGDISSFPQRQNSWHTDSEGPSRPRSASSRRSARRSRADLPFGRLVLGERLKQRFLEANVASTLLDLFFEFPWNNFLHSVVYDLIHQILTGRVDGGFNRELTVALFRDARLMHRIIEGSKRNDVESEKPKGVRLGYMGHLTLISEDVIGALEHLPPDLRLQIGQYAPQPEWDEYVTGRYKETKKKDTSLLGGGKPVVAPAMRNGAAQWKVDEADAVATAAVRSGAGAGAGTGAGTGAGADAGAGAGERPAVAEMKGEFRRTSSRREGSADFGNMPMDDEDEEFNSAPPRFANYLVQEMQSSEHLGSSDEASDDEEDGGWLAHSTFELRPPPVTARQHDNGRRPLSSSGFDDAFTPSSSSHASFQDPFEDDAFGPFSDSAAANGTDPFTFATTTVSDEFMADSSFDSFGDFGDFQSANAGAGAGSASFEDEGTLTPTGADSWSFASASSTGSFDEAMERRPGGEGSREQDERTARDGN